MQLHDSTPEQNRAVLFPSLGRLGDASPPALADAPPEPAHTGLDALSSLVSLISSLALLFKGL